MSRSGDPLDIADVLLVKTNAILNRLEKRHAKNGNNGFEDIYKDLQTYRELSSRRRVVEENAGKAVDQEAWKTELMKKIRKMEEELAAIKSTKMIGKTDLLLDIPSPGKKRLTNGVNAEEVKSNLLQTERIMDRGFKTARELNAKMEEMRRLRKMKAETSVKSESVSSGDSYIRGVAKDVTSLLVQRNAVRKAAKSQRVNTRSFVIESQDERPTDIPIPRGRRLVVQKLPDNHIRAPLTVQKLPSIDIAPESVPVVYDNTGVFVVKHLEETKERESPGIDAKREIGVQAELSEKTRNESLERLITNLGQNYREKNVIDDSRTFKHLLQDVKASGEKCEQLSQRDLIKPVSEDEYKSDFEVESLAHDTHTKSSVQTPSKVDGSSKTTSLSEDESLIEMQMKRLGLLAGKTEKTEKNVVYVRKNGKYLAVDRNGPIVQITVPEIVVRLPEHVNHEKQVNRLIQTDERLETLNGDCSSVVDQLNKRFQRTELLLERIGAKDLNGNSVLSLLKKRNRSRSIYAEKTSTPKQQETSEEDLSNVDERKLYNSCQSIGEVKKTLDFY